MTIENWWNLKNEYFLPSPVNVVLMDKLLQRVANSWGISQNCIYLKSSDIYLHKVHIEWGQRGRIGWLVDCFGFNSPLRQYSSLYRAVFQREGERKEK